MASITDARRASAHVERSRPPISPARSADDSSGCEEVDSDSDYDPDGSTSSEDDEEEEDSSDDGSSEGEE